MKRIFIAIKTEPEKTLQRMYASLRAALANEKITWVSPENIHLTLSFLGEIEEERVKVAGIVLKQKCTGFGEFAIRVSGTGIFRNLNDPKVLWLGIENPDRLIRLGDIINTGLKDTGFKIEDHKFNPHITLGRIKLIRNKEILKSAIAMYQEMFIQEVHIREVILYESILKPAGPTYHAVGKFHLK
jgi:RNA 2',3'-cyclic 3'-phosphodiesterase